MVEVEKCLDGLLKPLGFVETLGERKSVGNQEMERLLMEFSREKEGLLTMVVEQRLMIESLLSRVEKLEGATKGSSIVVEVTSMGVGMKVDDTSSLGDGRVIDRNPSKRRENGVKKERVDYGDRVCFHCHKRGHIQYTCNKLKKNLKSLKLLREMKKPTMEVGDGEKLKGKKRVLPLEKMKKATTLKKGVAKKKELPNLDVGLVKKTKSDDENGHVLLAIVMMMVIGCLTSY